VSGLLGQLHRLVHDINRFNPNLSSRVEDHAEQDFLIRKRPEA
jgi:hypothetical protein